MTGLYRNWNYSAPESADYLKYREVIEQLAGEKSGATKTPVDGEPAAAQSEGDNG